MTAGGWYSCGLRTDGTIDCWGIDYSRTNAPEERFTAVASDKWHSCALREDRTVACWGHDYFGETRAPEGRFDSLAVGEFVSCGLRKDGSFVCSGQGSSYLPEWLRALRFRALAPASYHTCGLSTSGRIYCWGSAAAYNFDLPDGTFTAITSGFSHSCGIRADGTVTCWGDLPVVPAPEGVRGVTHSPATPSSQGGPVHGSDRRRRPCLRDTGLAGPSNAGVTTSAGRVRPSRGLSSR